MPPAPPPPSSLLLRHRQLAPSANVKVSPLCLGAMGFGSPGVKPQGESTKEESFAVLDAFYGAGGNFIDTANGYQGGQSEERVGEWMEARGVRDEIVLATKYTMPHLGSEGTIKSNYGGNGSKSMKLSLEASLRRLRTSYIDIFYVHWWDYATSIEELMHSLNDLVVAGKVLYLGISDTPAWVVADANRYARDHGLRPFVIYQGRWNAGLRDFERDILPMCKAHGMAIASYGTLNSGRFQTKAAFAEREQANQGRAPPTAADKAVSAVLEAVAENKGSTIQHVALAYIIQKAPYVFPIVGCRTVGHVEGGVGALAVELTEGEIATIEGAYAFDHGFPHTWLAGTLYVDGATPRQAWGPQDVKNNAMTGATIDWVDNNPRAIRPPK